MTRDSMKFEMTEKEFITYEKIQNYIADSMKDAEKIAFEQELQADSELAKELEIYKNLIPVIAPPNAEVDALKHTLKSIHAKEKSIKTFSLRRYLPLAASLIIIMGLVKFFSTSFNTQSVDDFFKYEQLALVSKSTQNIDYASFEKSFNAADYEASIPLAQAILIGDPNNMDVLLAKGIAEMETGHTEAALASFKTLHESKLRIDRSEWYTALAHVKSDNKQAAIQVLQSLIQTKGYNHKQAQDLLKILEK